MTRPLTPSATHPSSKRRSRLWRSRSWLRAVLHAVALPGLLCACGEDGKQAVNCSNIPQYVRTEDGGYADPNTGAPLDADEVRFQIQTAAGNRCVTNTGGAQSL